MSNLEKVKTIKDLKTLKAQKDIDAVVFNTMALADTDLSALDVSNILGINSGYASRSLYSGGQTRPKIIDVSPSDKSKFVFVGNKAFLEPISDKLSSAIQKSVDEKLGGQEPAKASGKPVKEAETTKDSASAKEMKPTKDKGEAPGFNDNDKALVIQAVKSQHKNFAPTQLHKALSGELSPSRVDEVVSELKDLGWLEPIDIEMEEFEEEILSLTDSGKAAVAEMAPPKKKTAPKQKASKAEPAEPVPAKAESEEQKSAKKAGGRPQANRDYGFLREKITEFVAKQDGGVSKSFVAHNLSPQLEDFGRPVIGNEFMAMVQEGLFEEDAHDDGAPRPGRYRLPKKETAVASEKVDKGAGKVEETLAKAKDMVSDIGEDSEEVKKLREDILKLVSGESESLSNEIAGLFSRVADHMRSVEDQNRRLKKAMKTMIDDL